MNNNVPPSYLPVCRDCPNHVATERSKLCDDCKRRLNVERVTSWRQALIASRDAVQPKSWEAIKTLVGLGRCPTCGHQVDSPNATPGAPQ